MKKRNLKLYYINGDYIKYLKSFDHRVQNNYDNNIHQKPYVGIVLTINDKYYFAPLTSPKEKHLKLKNSDPTLFKIQDNHKFYGVVLLNNMIPINIDLVHKINISTLEDKRYQDLLNREYEIISKYEDKIKQKAHILYNSVITKSNHYFCHVSCDFQQLEIACDRYQPIKEYCP